MSLPVSAIILTYNEELNIAACLESIKDICDEIFVIDSGSTDNTLGIAKQFTEKIYSHPFENYSRQRNWALENLPLKNDWILNLDADHRVSNELAEEITRIFNSGIENDLNGFLISRRTVFMGRWIKHGGHYPTYHSNMFRNGFGKCEDKLYDQHYLVQGRLLKVKGDIVDIVTESLSSFIERHNRWSTLEAEYQLEPIKNDEVISASLSGNKIQQRRALKNFYEKFPLFIRSFLYFFYRYFLRLGFLDGREGLIFHFLQGFWFRFLIDAKIWERRRGQ